MLAIALEACASRHRNKTWRQRNGACYLINSNTIVAEGLGIPKSLDEEIRQLIKPAPTLLMLTAPPPPTQDNSVQKRTMPGQKITKKNQKKLTKRKKKGKSYTDEDPAKQKSISSNEALNVESPLSNETTKDWKRQFALLKKFFVQEKTKWKGETDTLKEKCSMYSEHIENTEKCLAMRAQENIELDGQLRNANRQIYCMEYNSRSYERHVQCLTNTNSLIFGQSMELREQLELNSKQLEETTQKLDEAVLQIDYQTKQALANEQHLIAIIQKLQLDKLNLKGQLDYSMGMRIAVGSPPTAVRMSHQPQKSADSSQSSSMETFQEYDTQSREESLYATTVQNQTEQVISSKQQQQKQKKPNNKKRCNKKNKKKKKSKRGCRKHGHYNDIDINNNNNNKGREVLPNPSTTESVATSTSSDIEIEILFAQAEVNVEGLL